MECEKDNDMAINEVTTKMTSNSEVWKLTCYEDFKLIGLKTVQ